MEYLLSVGTILQSVLFLISALTFAGAIADYVENPTPSNIIFPISFLFMILGALVPTP